MYPSERCQFCTIRSKKVFQKADTSQARLLQPTIRKAYAPTFCKGGREKLGLGGRVEWEEVKECGRCSEGGGECVCSGY